MRSVVHFDPEEAAPREDDVLHARGMPEGSRLSVQVRGALASATGQFHELALPAGLFDEVPVAEVEEIYQGEGCNPPESPLPAIWPRASGLALFAATMGEPICARIAELFHEHDLAVAYFLDAIASEAADLLSARLARRFEDLLADRGVPAAERRALPYSPGYCGWHVSGQRKLFARLRPQEIGIHLNQSCLMTPLKSVSGLIVAAAAEAHRFRADYPFCDACATRTCRHRIASLRAPA
jgi:hypothetical protein